jgi:hypothetical protein
MNRLTTVVASAIVALGLLASPAAPGNGPPVDLKGKKDVELKGPKEPGESPAVVTTESSDAAVIGVADLGPDAGLVGSNGQTLAAAATAATVYYRTWSQRMESLLWGIPWSETHKGLYYFNGNAVWVRSRFGWDTSGYHRCGYNSGIGFTVTVQSCWKTGDPSWVGSHMTNGDQFKVSALFHGFPISATHEMRACMYPSGYIRGC